MELIYFWINKSDNGILVDEDVMLSNEYEIHFDKEKRFLNIINNNNYYNIFKNNVITNVNAIVGSNGAGKTTLLEYIYRRDVQAYVVPDGEEMSGYDIDLCEKWTTIQVYQDKTKLLIVHNIKKGINITQSELYTVINTYTDIKRSNMEDAVPITKIYLTNSSYNYGINGYSVAWKSPTDIALTMQSITTFSNDFYGNSVNFPNSGITDNLYNGLQQIIISNRKENNFQQVCDLLYFNKLYKEQQAESFIGKIPIDLIIQSESLIKILDQIKKRKEPIKRYDSRINYSVKIKEKFSNWDKIAHKLGVNNSTLIKTLELNLFFELDFIYNIFEQRKIVIENDILKICSDNVDIIENDKERNYYTNAIKEIRNLKIILKEYSEFRSVNLSYKDKQEEYLDFLGFIESIVEKKESFVIKYLNITNLKMSSGERAYLNFFSWINLIPFFKKISSNNILENTKENILLLIDEIDLYCHPEWQRKMIKNILEELKLQFKNKKIQVIFTTHSPIVLSDIPLSNTLYVRKTGDTLSQIDDRAIHKETFSSNIYQLFNDSFFLQGKSAIGEYALDLINNILSKMKAQSLENNLTEIEAVLDIIGEPIIRNKLTNMLKKELRRKNINREIEPFNNNFKNNEHGKLMEIKKRLEELLDDINK